MKISKAKAIRDRERKLFCDYMRDGSLSDWVMVLLSDGRSFDALVTAMGTQDDPSLMLRPIQDLNPECSEDSGTIEDLPEFCECGRKPQDCLAYEGGSIHGDI